MLNPAFKSPGKYGVLHQFITCEVGFVLKLSHDFNITLSTTVNTECIGVI